MHFPEGVGFIAGWFIARVAVPACSPPEALGRCSRGFLIVIACGFAATIIGYVLGLLHRSDYSAWESMASRLGIVDLPSFVRVAYIHNASYLGGLIGLVTAVIYLRQQKRQSPLALRSGSYNLRPGREGGENIDSSTAKRFNP